MLLDLSGWTRGHRAEVLALRPSPSQIVFHGYAATSGAGYMQYIVSDRVASPPDYQAHYSEKLLLMPPSFLLSEDLGADPCAHITPRPQRADLSLPNDGFVLANFNSLYKLDNLTFRGWVEVLHELDSAVLLLLRIPAAAETRLREKAESWGLAPHRLVFSVIYSRGGSICASNLSPMSSSTQLSTMRIRPQSMRYGPDSR